MSFWDELQERKVDRLVELWKDLRERRLFRIVGTYLGAGWLVLEGADMLVDRDLISELAYRLVLVGYLSGIPASLVVGWFHGEKGVQKLTLPEIGWLTLIGAGAVAGAAGVVQEYETSPETLAERSSLDLRRIAVLHYDDLSSDADFSAVAQGLTESLIGDLQQVNQLEVISENGVRPYRHAAVTPDSVARALDVGTVITGAINGRPEQMQITTRLVDGQSGAVVNQEVITTSQDELLAARDSISRVLSRQLRRFIGQELTYRTERAGTADTRAWVLLQRGDKLVREARSAAGHGRTDSAMALFAQADSAFAASGRTDTSWVEPLVGRARVAYRKGRTLVEVAGDRHRALGALEAGLQHAERALSLAPGHAKALELRGNLRYAKYIYGLVPDPDRRRKLVEKARDDLEAAVDADPTLPAAYSSLSHLYYQPPVRDLVDVALSARRAYEADAYLESADGVLWRLVQAHQDLGQFSQARRWCEEGRDRFPQDFRFRLCRLWLLATPEIEPNAREAWRLAHVVDSLAPADEKAVRRTEAEMYVGAVLARAGLSDSARSVLSRAQSRADSSVDPQFRDYLILPEAHARVLLGDEDGAIRLLSRYVSEHPSHDFAVAGDISWRWRPLQDHPDFRKIRAVR